MLLGGRVCESENIPRPVLHSKAVLEKCSNNAYKQRAMDERKHTRCKRCGCWRWMPTDFMSDSGRMLKTCSRCRELAAWYRAKARTNCGHGNRPESCKACDDTAICEHGIHSNVCKAAACNVRCAHHRRLRGCATCLARAASQH